jgi:hypothetical protein
MDERASVRQGDRILAAVEQLIADSRATGSAERQRLRRLHELEARLLKLQGRLRREAERVPG